MEANNNAKVREALERIAAIPMPPPDELAQSVAVEMREVAIAALSAPPRNCDVGTLTEQQLRFRDFCEKMQNKDKASCGGCPIVHLLKGVISSCELVWAQMPYEEGGAK